MDSNKKYNDNDKYIISLITNNLCEKELEKDYKKARNAIENMSAQDLLDLFLGKSQKIDFDGIISKYNKSINDPDKKDQFWKLVASDDQSKGFNLSAKIEQIFNETNNALAPFCDKSKKESHSDKNPFYAFDVAL